MDDLVLGEGRQIGAYRLERKLGAGSTSEVYLATHTEIGRRVAIKVLAPEVMIDSDIFARFVEEARIVNAVHNEHIVQIYDVLRSEQPKLVAFVMELVQGPSFKAIRPHRLSPAQATGVALQLASAVGAAHAAGIIHRDLKPENMLFTTDPREEPAQVVPRLKVIDFGIAKQVGGPARTAVGQILGTPAYMAPEQIVGNPPTSAASDVYAVGEICFELWTGKRAFEQTTSSDCIRAKLRGEHQRFEGSTLTGRAHDLAEVLIAGTLAQDPIDRPPLADVRTQLLEIARILAAGEDVQDTAKPVIPDDAKTSLLEPAPIPDAKTKELPTDTKPSGPRRRRIPVEPTAPGASSAEPPTEEGLATVAGDMLEEPPTDEALPIVVDSSSVPVIAADTVMEIPADPIQPGSYESLGALLHMQPTEPPVPEPQPSKEPLPPPPPLTGTPVRQQSSKLSGAWMVAVLLMVVALGLLAVVILTRPG